MNKYFTMFCLMALFSVPLAHAQQQYRWVKGGGSSCFANRSIDNDQVTNMVTDVKGRVYVLASVGGTDISADTFYRPYRHYPGGACNQSSSLFLSYDCNGNMRWAKMFDTYGSMTINDMCYDNAASIYMVGWCTPGYTKYYTDTTVTNPNYSMYLMKYDTSGKFQWIRFLGANNTANQSQTWGVAHSIAIDAQGNPHYIVNLKTGMQVTPTLTSQAGTYEVKFTSGGTLVSATRLPLDSLWNLNKSIIVPGGNMYSMGIRLEDGVYNTALMKFDASRNIIWNDTTGNTLYAGVNSFTFDGLNSFYIAGYGQSSLKPFKFAGLTASNTYFPGYVYATITKVDTNGVGKWVVHYDCSQGGGGLNTINLLPNGTLAAAGSFVWTLRRGNDSLVTPSNEGWNPYLVILDTSGKHLWFDQLHGLGFVDNALSGATDHSGNFYFGGQFESNITATGLGSGITSTGGNTDFFIMKYGYPCNCPAPTAHFNAGTPSGKSVSYTYSGTTSGLDSLVWNFGDGATQTVKSGFTTPVSHTFISNGRFNVCVTAYATCGVNTYCQQTALAVGSMSLPDGMKVYPNPAQEVLNVEGAGGATFSLSNHIGQQVLQGRIHTAHDAIDIHSLPSGTYLLQLTDQQGRRGVMMVLKQ